jgi:hypothetical protein
MTSMHTNIQGDEKIVPLLILSLWQQAPKSEKEGRGIQQT